MSLNESIVEDAALEWFGESPLVSRLRNATWGVNSATHHSNALATERYRLVRKLVGGDMGAVTN
jgi:hypothetical protein